MFRPLPAACLAAALLGGPAVHGADGEWGEGEVLFAVEVAPVLAQKCGACHGDDPADLGGEFDLRTRDSLLAGGESGEPGIIPGTDGTAHADGRGYLYELLEWHDGYGMPPKEADRLSEEQLWAVRDWIDAGAPWPDAATVEAIRDAHDPGVRVPTSGGLADDWTDRTYDPADVWAYRPRTDPPVPANPAGFSEPADPVDAFLNVKLADAGLDPAPRADRRTLIRRATFDLTGLPPTPAEIDAFLNDPAGDAAAFAAVVDRLLESPHYGEQMATRWLDVARYADSAGMANDFERPHAWRYRDYVVRAFNDDKPYDRFVLEQIAGDELVDHGPLEADTPAGIDAMVATGFLRMAPWEHTGMTVHAVTRGQFLDEVTDAVGQAFLAQPLQCAKCHDHKFDPIPTRDYYAIRGAFVTTQFADRSTPFHPAEDPRDFGASDYKTLRIAEARAVVDEIEAVKLAAQKKWYADRGLEYATDWKKRRQGVPADQIAPKVIELTPEQFGMERVAKRVLQRFTWELDQTEPYAFAVYNGATVEKKHHYAATRLPENRMAGELQTPAILVGGDVFSRGEPVAPGVLSAALLSVTDDPDPSVSDADRFAGLDPVPDEAVDGRRTALAKWITAESNPLTARVYANRLWQWAFGRGISANANNFGGGGAKPTHPALLDHLAARLIDGGWRTKPLVRALVLSDAYARASVHPDPAAVAEHDPDGVLLAAFRPRRLSAEELRDAMLAVSGELNPAVGGVPVRHEMNPAVALQPRMVMGTFAPAWQAEPDPRRRHRRSLYTTKLRGLRDPLLESFNAPAPDAPCELRETSTVAPQALALLNGKATYGRALAAAADVLPTADPGDAAGDDAAVAALFRRAFGREPDAAEVRACVSHWHAMTARHASLHFDPERPPAKVTRTAVEENTGVRFTYEETLEQSADFVPDLGPADADARTRGLAEVALALLNANEFLYVE